MKKIILTCSGVTFDPEWIGKPKRFVIEIDENTGDAQIVDENAPLIERDRSALLDIRLAGKCRTMTLEVEAA